MSEHEHTEPEPDERPDAVDDETEPRPDAGAGDEADEERARRPKGR